MLVPADDISIWNWAKTNVYVIVTNDDDFYNLANTYGFPPKVVLLRMGNQSSSSVVATRFKHTDDLRRLADSDEYGILELF
ncbi:DUF5615 family PIN-like protein [Fibrella sp. WM1]|uniref:DUF5615 family PIN-like protein n=1 Tax=Fibrella musci TaxID=3242485 RepID=UPI003520498D